MLSNNTRLDFLHTSLHLDLTKNFDYDVIKSIDGFKNELRRELFVDLDTSISEAIIFN